MLEISKHAQLYQCSLKYELHSETQNRYWSSLISKYVTFVIHMPVIININNLNTELNPICHLLALLGAHPILHISRIRVKVFWNVTQCSLVDGYLSATQDAIIPNITTIKAKICSFYNLFLVAIIRWYTIYVF
jgi:hypothetical protein